VAVKEVIDSAHSEAHNSACKVYEQWPSWSVMYKHTFLRNYRLDVKPVELRLVNFGEDDLFPV